jgi:hypothetical protein
MLSDFKWASGVLVHADSSGVQYTAQGQIVFEKPDPKGIDSSLFAVLKIAVDHLHIAINVNSLTTGTHVPTSRHYSGRAADINRIGSMDGPMMQSTLQNAQALRLVAFLRQNGWHLGEGGPWPGLFLGPPHTGLNVCGVDHSRHLHVSIPRRPQPGAAPGEEASDGGPEE